MIHILLFIIYLAFISLGLPDGLLGSAWPNMRADLNVPISYAGIITIIICIGTVISSLFSGFLNRKLKTGLIVAISVLLTATALLGFYFSHSFILLCIFAIPYGFGAGSIDAALNNYVAIHYKSKHMSWLHCMWGIGATVGPYAMSYVLTNNMPWNNGYLCIAIIQLVLTFIMFMSLPLWKKRTNDNNEAIAKKLSFKDIISTKGFIILIICFFSYSALEQTTILWASSYLIAKNGISDSLASSLASLFFIGITSGRFISGFIAIKLKDRYMIRVGYTIIIIGIILLLFNSHISMAYIGLILIGLGCAPIYPSVIHSVPGYFGIDKSQSLIGILMAMSYTSTLFMPPFFGVLADLITQSILPIYLLIFLIILISTHELVVRKVKKNIS